MDYFERKKLIETEHKTAMTEAMDFFLLFDRSIPFDDILWKYSKSTLTSMADAFIDIKNRGENENV